MGLQQSPTTLSPLAQTVLAKINEREIQRQQHPSESYYRIEIILKPGRIDAFAMPLCRMKSQKHPHLSEAVAKAVALDLKELSFKLLGFETAEKKYAAAPPLADSDLLLYAAVHWHWPQAQTEETIAQLLKFPDPLLRYGVDAALIDGTRLRILSDYGVEYLPRVPKKIPSTMNHRNILAPSDINKTPKKLRRRLTAAQFTLYQLLWTRFLAWQTGDALLRTAHIQVIAGEDQRYLFERRDSGILFRGYMQVHEQESDIALRHQSHIWDTTLGKRESLRLVDVALIKEQTPPPARFSPETLIKSVIADRRDVQFALAQLICDDYVRLNGLGLEPTEKADAVPLPQAVLPGKNTSDTRIAAEKAPAPEIPVARLLCPKCGKRLVTRQGQYGRFLACSGYPACRHTQPIAMDIPCPRAGCNGHLVQRRSGNGAIFYGCSEYPRCRHTQTITE